LVTTPYAAACHFRARYGGFTFRRPGLLQYGAGALADRIRKGALPFTGGM